MTECTLAATGTGSWLWLGIAGLIILGMGVGAVALSRRQRAGGLPRSRAVVLLLAALVMGTGLIGAAPSAPASAATDCAVPAPPAPPAPITSPAATAVLVLASSNVTSIVGEPAALTIANTGTAAARPIAVEVPSGMIVDATSCIAGLQPSASCTILISASAPVSGVVTISADSAVAPVTAQVEFVAPPALVASPTTLQTVPDVPVAVTVTNTSTAVSVVDLSATVSPVGSFTIAESTCSSALAPGSSCTIAVLGTATSVPAQLVISGSNSNTVTVQLQPAP